MKATVTQNSELSPFSQAIFSRTYAFTPEETWQQCARRVAKAVAMGWKQEERFYDIISKRIFIPGGRYLYSAGRPKFVSNNCLPVETLIHTENGLIPIEKIKIGDSVLSSSGSYHSVGAVFNPGIQPTVKISTTHGDFISTHDHPWFVIGKGVVEAYHIVPGDQLESVRGHVLPGTSTFLPQAENISGSQGPARTNIKVPSLTAEIAWMIGTLHGDGCVSNGIVSIVAQETSKQEKLYRVFQLFGLEPHILHNGVDKVQVYGINVSNYFKKFKTPRSIIRIPDFILMGSPEIRAAYIAGIYDTDGSETYQPLMLAASCYKELLEQLQALCSSLGALTSVKFFCASDAKGRFKNGKDLWKLTIHKEDLKILRPFIEKHTTKSIPTCTRKEQLHPVVVTSVQDSDLCDVYDIRVEESHEFIMRGIRSRNCYGFVAGDSREEWADLLHDVTMCLSTGGGLGVVYSKVRPFGSPIKTMGGIASGPLSLMQMVNEVARHVMAGGKRRSALWGGLHWKHPDIQAFITAKDWSKEVLALKAQDFEFPAKLDMTNISVIVDDEYIHKLYRQDPVVVNLHRNICEHMAKNGEPAFRNESRVFLDDPRATTTNACCETQLWNRDVCNLGSINLAKIESSNHLEEVTRVAIQFLYNGSLKTEYPVEQIRKTAQETRRIGLGLMGIHEFMLLHNQRYEWFRELENYASVWAESATDEGKKYSGIMSNNPPINTRAIAPNGTISIIGMTTSGIEPVFCTSYKRRYINAGKHYFQYVIDPTAKRLMDLGIRPHCIEDTYSLSLDLDRRLDVQANMQQYVDQAISNTVNLPTYGTNGNNNTEQFADLIAKYLPQIKGLTMYPDNSRPGQPLVKVPIEEALGQEGVVYEEDSERCLQGVCGL